MSAPENRAADLHAALQRARAMRPGEHVLIVVASVADGEVITDTATRVGRGETLYADVVAQTTNALAQAASEFAADVATRLAKYHRGLS